MRKLPRQSGQVLLIIVLVMAVALTIGLSVVSRSITDIKISQVTEESARAFSAAEAGIEQALITGSSSQSTFDEISASFETQVVGIGSGATEFVFPQDVSVDDPQTVYLAEYQVEDGSLTPYYDGSEIDVCWNGNAALEVDYYYQDSTYKVSRTAVDPVSSRRDSNHFDSPSNGNCAGLSHRKTVDVSSGTPLFLRIRTLYENAKVGVSVPQGGGGGSQDGLPSQGNQISSTGQAGSTTRRVEVVRYHPAPPPIFDFVLYSGGSLSK